MSDLRGAQVNDPRATQERVFVAVGWLLGARGSALLARAHAGPSARTLAARLERATRSERAMLLANELLALGREIQARRLL